MSPLDFWMMGAISAGDFRPIKVIISLAMDFRYCSSGQEPIMINGFWSLSNNLMMRSHSLTKATNLPT
jgi:hypothetical protein